jgi:peptidylprolyl isomerase
MTRRLPIALLCTAALFSGCVNSITGTRCESTPFSVAEVRADTTITTTGLRYIDGQPGTGPNAVQWCKSLAIHYEAYLEDGTRYDSTRERDAPFIFTPGLGALIDGLEQGVIGMRTQGTRRLIIPPALGFGPEPRRDQDGRVIVPGNSTVIYDIEVLLVEP